MTDVLLETRSLHRSFGGLHAVKDVSFNVPQGAIKAVIGPNGAGKTTLFNLIAGHHPAPRRRGPLSRQADHRLEAARRRSARDRPDLPDHEALPAHDRPGERHGRPASADALGVRRRAC